MAANKPGKAEILAAFFDDGTYSPLFTDGAVSAAYGCANGQNAYVVFEDGSPVGVQDIEKNIRVLEMAAETGAPVVTFYDSTGAKLEGGLALLNANARLTAEIARVSGVVPQVAVVIGGGQTLGAFLCHGLAAEGYRVAVVDIQSDKAANVAQEINAEYGESMAYGFGADATSEQSVLALSRGVDEIFGRVDLLVYSAGIAKAAFISDFQLGDFDRSLQVNLVGYFLCAREFSRLMIRDGIQGRIIQINSKSGKVGSKHNSGYSAAKFGGVGLTQSLALDLAEYGITVHSLDRKSVV